MLEGMAGEDEVKEFVRVGELGCGGESHVGVFGVSDSPFGHINPVRLASVFVEITHQNAGSAANFEGALRLENVVKGESNFRVDPTVSRRFAIVPVGRAAGGSILEIGFIEIVLRHNELP